MDERIQRSIEEPIRLDATHAERWRGPDHGLVTCWEVGRKLREQNPGLAERALAGELPMLGWKGGVEKKLKIKAKYGTLKYLAQWQALRSEDLDIDLSQEYDLTCSRTGMRVIDTGDKEKWSQP